MFEEYSLSTNNLFDDTRIDKFLIGEKKGKIKQTQILPIPEEKTKTKKNPKKRKKDKKKKKRKIKAKSTRPKERKRLNSIEKEIINLEYLQLMKNEHPKDFKKLVKEQVLLKDFKIVLEKMKYREETVKQRKDILKEIYSPERNYNFFPKINNNSKIILSKSASNIKKHLFVGNVLKSNTNLNKKKKFKKKKKKKL